MYDFKHRFAGGTAIVGEMRCSPDGTTVTLRGVPAMTSPRDPLLCICGNPKSSGQPVCSICAAEQADVPDDDQPPDTRVPSAFDDNEGAD